MCHRNVCTGIYAEMAAALCSSDVLQMFDGPTTEEESINPPRASQPDVVAYFDVLTLAQSNFGEWLLVWRMDVPERNANTVFLRLLEQQKKSLLI